MSDTARPDPEVSSAAEQRADAPRYRPLRRFWPYVQLTEQPTLEEMAALDPDLEDALFGPRHRPFSLTIVFPRFDGPDYGRALEIARASAEYREVGEGDAFRSRARFSPSGAEQLHALFTIVGRLDQTEVLIDDRPLPYARELWLPLVWLLLPR
jgi:hypothetical protein